MVRVQAVALVLVVVIEVELLAGGVGQSEHGIQGRIEPPGIDLGDDLLAGTALEAEDVPVAGPIDPPIDDHGERDRLGVLRRIVGLLFKTLGQGVDGKGHAVEDREILAQLQRIGAGGLAAGVHGHSADRKVAAAQFHDGLRAGRQPNGKMSVMKGSSPTVMR